MTEASGKRQLFKGADSWQVNGGGRDRKRHRRDGRALRHRRITVVKNHEEAISALESLNPQRVFTASEQAGKEVVFMFPGLDPALREQLAENGKKWVEEQFAWHHQAKQLPAAHATLNGDPRRR